MFPSIEFIDGEAGLTHPPIYVADLEHCLPAEGIAAEPSPDRWHAYPFETDKVAGTILSVGEETIAPEIRYPLAVSGWHAISVGLYQDRYFGDMSVQVRLSDDPGFSVLTVKDGPLDVIYDVFWRIADLTGRQVHFGQLPGPIFQGWRTYGLGTRVRIAYLKLVPLTPDEVAAYQAESARTDTKRLFTHQDGGLLAMLMREDVPGEVYREIEPFRDTDFARIYWEAGFGDLMLYPSQMARTFGFKEARHFPFVAERLAAESWQRMKAKGLDPFGLALQRSHEIGLEFHACYRPAGFYFPPPEDYFNEHGFFEQHPELRMIARDGRPMSRIAYSFPETRRYVVELMREIADYPVDGIAILYNRAPPLVAYEPELVDSFRDAHGEDPRDLPEDDPRWLAWRCRALTTFMRDLRSALDDVAEARGQGRRIGITAVVLGTPEENLFHGMDVGDWIARDLVDTVVPFTDALEMNSVAESFADLDLVRRWVALTSGGRATLAMNIMPRWYSPAGYRRKAAAMYEAGVDQLFFWDGYMRVNYFDQLAWNAMRQLGHRDEISRWAAEDHAGYNTSWVPSEDPVAMARWLAAGKPPLGPTSVTLQRLAGWDVATGTPA